MHILIDNHHIRDGEGMMGNTCLYCQTCGLTVHEADGFDPDEDVEAEAKMFAVFSCRSEYVEVNYMAEDFETVAERWALKPGAQPHATSTDILLVKGFSALARVEKYLKTGEPEVLASFKSLMAEPEMRAQLARVTF